MIWVGGSIILHGLAEIGYPAPYETIHHWAVAAAGSAPPALAGTVEWLTTAFLDGVVGLILGLILIPVAVYVIGPIAGLFSRKDSVGAE
jgi:predicted DNA repair protein MutK